MALLPLADKPTSFLCRIYFQANLQTPPKDVHHAHGPLHHLNQVPNVLSSPHRHKRRWSQHRSSGVLPKPEPEEETKPFVLDLKNFPELANADISSQNPNIQVNLDRDQKI